MKFKEQFSYKKRSRKLLRTGNDLQKEGLNYCDELIKLLNLNEKEVFLINTFTHPQLATSKLLNIDLEIDRKHLLKKAFGFVSRLSKNGASSFSITRKSNSAILKFMWKDWEVNIELHENIDEALKRTWIRDFLLTQVGPIHIAKIVSLIQNGVRTSSAFKEIISNWVPDNKSLQRLLELQEFNFKEKPLMRMDISGDKILSYRYKQGKWILE